MFLDSSRPKRRRLLLYVLAAALVLGGGAAAAYFSFVKKQGNVSHPNVEFTQPNEFPLHPRDPSGRRSYAGPSIGEIVCHVEPPSGLIST